MSAFTEEENIWTAASDGDLERVKVLLSQGISVNALDENGYSPIHGASSYGHTDLIKFLVTQGADVNLCDPDGDTPLLVCEDSETFELLVQCGADPLARNKQGQGILEKAVEDENEELLGYLLSSDFIKDPELREQMQKLLTEGLCSMEEGGNIDLDALMEEDGEDDEEEGEEAAQQ